MRLLFVFLICWTALSCVQKSYDQTITVVLDVSEIPNIKTVGVRGSDKPLSWREDFEMKQLVKDSLYTVTFSGKTGLLFTEIKFVVNGEFEFKDQYNRRVFFDKSRKTIYKATFNKIN